MADPSTPKHIAVLLDFIAKPESNGNWNAYFRHANSTHPVFATMTVDDILAWQRQFTVSTATGRYQFMRQTLSGLKAALGLTGRELFTNAMQDRLATRLLVERGLDQWLAGRLSTAAFARNLACEWASLPDPNTGSSVYAHDGLNKSLVKVSEVYAVLAEAKKLYLTASPTTPAPKEC